MASLSDHIDIVQLLIKARADKEKRQNNGQTPLAITAERSNLEIACLLIQARADTDKAQADGTTALVIEAERSNLQIVRLLIEARADAEKAQKDGTTSPGIAPERGNAEPDLIVVGSGTPSGLTPTTATDLPPVPINEDQQGRSHGKAKPPVKSYAM